MGRVGLWFFVVLLFCTCSKDKQDELVPYTYVNIPLNVNSASFSKLNAVGGWVYITGGVEGIIVYRKSIDEYAAMDRCCTYRVADRCRVRVDGNNVIAVDSCCGSQFQITDGVVVKGPATRGLKQYNTNLSGSVLYITN